MSLADAKYMDCSCCGPKGVARGGPGALCPACEDAGCEPFVDVCKVKDKLEAVHASEDKLEELETLGQAGGGGRVLVRTSWRLETPRTSCRKVVLRNENR